MVATADDIETGGADDPADLVDSPRAWTVVAAAFLATFAVYAPTYAFGVFFEAMEETFDAQASATALIFAIATFLYFGGGAITGRIADRIGPRPVVLVGAVVMTLGLLATSRVDSLWLAYITYGLGVGIGVACGYVPMVAPIGSWFDRRRSLAMGLAVAGIGMSWLVAPRASQWLIDAHGWRTAYVVLALAVGALLALAAMMTAPALGGPPPDPPGFATIARFPGFGWIYVSGFFGTIALFTPFVFLVRYATDHGISDGAAAWLLAVLGGTSVVGRLGLGALAGRVPIVRLYQMSFALMAASFVIWLVAGSSYATLALFGVVLGIGYGGFIALAPAVAAHLYGTEGLGAVLGLQYTSAGVGGLIGPPLGGLLFDVTDDYTATIVMALVFGIVAVALLMPVRTTGTTTT